LPCKSGEEGEEGELLFVGVGGVAPVDHVAAGAMPKAAELPFVRIEISLVSPSGHVLVNTMTSMFGSTTPTAVEPSLRVITPAGEIDTAPFWLLDVPSPVTEESEHVPSWFMKRRPLCHHGAPGPEARLLSSQMPTSLVIE
jgi:hypothetical protein